MSFLCDRSCFSVCEGKYTSVSTKKICVAFFSSACFTSHVRLLTISQDCRRRKSMTTPPAPIIAPPIAWAVFARIESESEQGTAMTTFISFSFLFAMSCPLSQEKSRDDRQDLKPKSYSITYNSHQKA